MTTPDERLRRLMGVGYKPPRHKPIWVWRRFYLCERCRPLRVVPHTKVAEAYHVVAAGHFPLGLVWECNWILHVLSVTTYAVWWERIPLLTRVLFMTTCKAPELGYAKDDLG